MATVADEVKKEVPVNNPHDHLFKAALADARIARELFQNYLDKKIQKKINWKKFQQQPVNFIDPQLKSSETDVLYRTELLKEKQQTCYLYLLVEHQSTPDKWLPYRIIKYITRAFDFHRRQYPNDPNLPLIIPLIFYTGNKKYSNSTDLFQLFGEQAELAKQYLFGPYSLIDLNSIDDSEIYKHRWLGMVELVMKHAQARDTISLLKDLAEHWFSSLLDEPGTDSTISSVLKYTLDQGQIKNLTLFFSALRKQLPTKTEGKVMTIAELLRQEGMQQGIQQGETSIILRQLARKFGKVTNAVTERVLQATTSQLLIWSDKILTAQTLEEVFE